MVLISTIKYPVNIVLHHIIVLMFALSLITRERAHFDNACCTYTNNTNKITKTVIPTLLLMCFPGVCIFG